MMLRRIPLDKRSHYTLCERRFAFVFGAILLAASLLLPEHAASHPLNIAHRGGTIAAPENTLVNFQTGIDNGADWIEIDVWESSDGFLVIHHDDTLDRTTNGTGFIYEHTLAELRALDAGSWFSPEFAGEQIPTLEESLNLITPQGIAYLDIKDRAYIPNVAAVIDQLGIPQHQIVAWIRLGAGMANDYRTHLPNSRIVFGMGHWAQVDESLLWQRAEAGDYGIAPRYETLTSDFVDLAHSYGLAVHTYKVLSPSYQNIIDMGVDGLVVAAPSRLAPLLPASQPECSDGIDNDGDQKIDFPNEPGCFGPEGPVELTECSDGIDNDLDGATDYPDDPGCYAPFSLNEAPQCSDGIDNDGSGFLDYPDDPGCFKPFDSREDTQCNDGLDNDGDGQIDWPWDKGCFTRFSALEAPACNDGRDNDGDELIDFPDDPGCEFSWSDHENPACVDEMDNDDDGLIDFPDDEGCFSPFDVSEIRDCQDGLDNDLDGKTDWPADRGCRAADSQREFVHIPSIGPAGTGVLAWALLLAGIARLRERPM
jgi:glycerophosphoryl diester phosphodiesterase